MWRKPDRKPNSNTHKMKNKEEVEAYIHAMQMEATSMNKYLKNAVKSMNIIILLRHCHPIYRGEHARFLYINQLISKRQALEFVNLI
jgi:hypothetical protein